MRIHLGSGSIYLREFVNVDLALPNVFLAKERHDLVEKYITTEDKYYARHDNKTLSEVRKGPLNQEMVCDAYGSFSFIPARPGTVDEILSRQCFEHLDRQEAHEGLKSAHQALKVGGFLRIDIPDPDDTLKKYQQTGDEFYIRHLFGPRRDTWGFHTHYTRRMLREMVESHGFFLREEEENIHWYPAFCLKFERLK